MPRRVLLEEDVMKMQMKMRTALMALMVSTMLAPAAVADRGSGRDSRDRGRDERGGDRNSTQDRGHGNDRGRGNERAGDHREDRGGYRAMYSPTRYTMRTLSRARLIVSVGRDRFYYDQGRFFRPGTYGYMWVAAPFGARIPRLPLGFTIRYYSGRPYYYCAGTYYTYDAPAGDYVVTNPPPSASNFDVIVMTDGSSLAGLYLGGDENTIHFEVGGTIYDVDRSNVVSLSLANPDGR
jgi:hypothetical protein